MTTKPYVLFVLFLVVAVTFGAGEGPPDTDLLNGGGVPFNEDQRNGEAFERERENEERMEERKENETTGENGNYETMIQNSEALYFQWRQDYFDSGTMPEISEKVQKFMDETGITIDQVKAEYERTKNQGNSTRKKRSLLASGSGVWTKCIIPYVYHDSISDSVKIEMEKVHSYYERLTGFRFVKWDNTTQTEYGLDHNNFIRYGAWSGCWSFVGNLGRNGQNLSPCGGGGVAIHELGHAFGMVHEQKNPQSFPYLRVEYDNIKPSYRSQYYRNDFVAVNNTDGFYDISSRMHYGRTGFNQNYGYTMTANDPSYSYLIGSANDFYMFKEIQDYHKCYDQFDSCTVRPECHNGGFVSVVDGSCQCLCPSELDPSTNCRTKFATNLNLKDMTWPDGTYTLLKTTDTECPAGFENGTMVHWPVSHIWKSNPYHHSPVLSSYELPHDLCTKTIPVATSNSTKAVWGPGHYCILRYGGTCPEGFQMGYQDTYGPVKQNDTNIGTLPDGNHGYLFEYIFCCREDGSRKDPIQLPTKEPFILYMKDSRGCQEVEDAQFYTEYYNFKSNTSETLNETGLLPYMYRYDAHRRNIYFCYYKPISKDCGMVKEFLDGETTFTFTSPGYPKNYDNFLMCYWHFQSPKGTKMYLDFTDFEVFAADSSSCNDHVEISFVEPSMKGFSVCGHGYKKTTWTWDNFLSLKLTTRLGDTYKGFNATITVYKDEELCYHGDGSDGSYAGNVNYAKTFDPCIPWYKAAKCPFGKFNSRVVDSKLSGNTCRNVGVGTQPWCYTNAETCERQECDACMWGSCYDVFLDCETQISNDSDYCSKNTLGEAHRGCMKSCGVCDQRLRKGKVSCGAPPDVLGVVSFDELGVLNREEPTTYEVGDVVTYRCLTSHDTRTSTCTSEGTWTEVDFVCESCPTGFAVYNQRCFKWLGWMTKVDYDTAVSMCNETRSILAKIDSPEIATFVQRLVEYSEYDNTGVWLGIKADDERVWYWGDNTTLTGWTNWKSGQPNNWGRNQYCGELETDKGWGDTACSTKKSVVCEYRFDETRKCDDQLPNCEAILQENPETCTKHSVFSTHMCKTSCGIGDCHADVQCADDQSLPEYHASRVAGSETLTPGQFVSYECEDGFVVKSGDAVRVCSSSGNLTGSNLICEATDVCGDFLPNCQYIWSQNPKFCEQNQGYADRYCRSTCGMGVCRPNVTCSDEGSLSTFATRIHGTGALNVGQYYEYSCQTGKLKTSGDYVRVCQSNGELSGSPLTCACYNWTENLVIKGEIARKEEFPFLSQGFLKSSATAMIQCEDKITTCEQILQETPEMCQVYSGYAWQNCMKTCAFAECHVPTQCTDDTDQDVGAFMLRGSAQINVGDYVEYHCSEGYIKTGGDTKRACLPSGTLTGSPITCTSTADCENDLPECGTMLAENPKMCQEFKQFAFHSCRSTCGYDETSVTCTDDTSPTSKATRHVGSDSLKPGQYLEYSCEEDYLRETGDYIRVCMSSGNLTGSPLSCTRSSTIIACDDLYEDCPHRLEMNPALCGMFPDYTNHFCRKSCGMEECQPTTTCDAVPVHDAKVVKLTGSDQLKVGEFSVYNCIDPFLKDSGSFRRACLPSGILTGATPICSLSHEESTPSILCEDQSKQCEMDLQETPDMCARYPDYSWHNCRKTCGVGECRPRITCVDDTNLGYRATRLTGNDKVHVGEHIEYECNDGYLKGSGNAIRACLPGGQLTGSPLICLHKDVTTNVDLFTDKEIFKRRETSSSSKLCMVANVTDMRFTVAGNVTSWTFFSNYGGEIAFQVWRLNESNPLSLKLIGQNIITDSPNERKVVYSIPEDDQIFAKVGDLIGIYQLSSELAYTRCDKAHQPENAVWRRTVSSQNHANKFTVGDDHLFKDTSRNCRVYSVRASVNPSACSSDGDELL